MSGFTSGGVTSDIAPEFSDTVSTITLAQVLAAIDHTKLTFSSDEDPVAAVRQLCREAVANQFYAVCVRPAHVKLACRELEGTEVKVATVIGFPAEKVLLENEKLTPTVGGFALEDKLLEIHECFSSGLADGLVPDEFDLVMNISQFKKEMAEASLKGISEKSVLLESHLSNTVDEFSRIRDAAQGRPVKVIIETDLLSDLEIIIATQCCAKANVAMVKTSTGMITGGVGATEHAVALIAKTLNERGESSRMGIKASGGVKTLTQAQRMLALGATRLGTSSGVEIARGVQGDTQTY
ncbi:MAG: deoxyribose-phosphate aldolase [Cyanobacteria bacterium]|nr:deoxyribose-phosphate aldolase [Cyanobacteriota bacterium]